MGGRFCERYVLGNVNFTTNSLNMIVLSSGGKYVILSQQSTFWTL